MMNLTPQEFFKLSDVKVQGKNNREGGGCLIFCLDSNNIIHDDLYSHVIVANLYYTIETYKTWQKNISLGNLLRITIYSHEGGGLVGALPLTSQHSQRVDDNHLDHKQSLGKQLSTLLS